MNFHPDGSIRSVFSGEIFWQSGIRQIGKHDWKITIYQDDNNVFVDYEWCRAAERIKGVVTRNGEPYISEADPWWKPASQWPKYDGNKSDAGLPRTLASWYAEHKETIQRTLAKARAQIAQNQAAPATAAPEPGM